MKRWMILGCCLLLLSGCSHTYLERQVYPLCLSIDLNEEGKYEIGLQAPRSMVGDQASYDILTAVGDTPEDALRVLAASTPYPLNFSQIRLCLISYELAATTPLRALLRVIFELPGMRPNAQVMVAQGSAQEVMKAQRPDFGQRLSTHLNLLFERMRREQTLPDSSLSYCIRELSDGRSDLLLCLCAVNPRLKPQQEQAAFALGEPWSDQLLPENEIAGLLTRSGPNPVEYVGSAAVSDGRVCGILSAQETQLAVRTLDEAERRVAMEGDFIQLQVLLPRDSTLEPQAVTALVQKLQAMHSDALLFGCEASTAFWTDAAWEGLRFRSRYPAAAVAVGTK